MKSVVCVLIIYTIWTFLDFFNIFIIYDKFLFVERKLVRKRSLLWIPIILTISYIYGLQYADIYYNSVIAFLINIPFFFKVIPLLWCVFPRKIKDVLMILFYQLLVATISQGLYMFVNCEGQTVFYELFFYDLCEVLTVALITLFLMVLLFFRKNNIFKVYFWELSVFQYITFCIALFVANFIEAEGIMLYSDNFMIKVLSFLNVIMVCILVCQFILVRESETRKGMIIDILDEQMDKVTGYYNELIEQETQTKKFRHDIKNLLLALYSMVEQGEVEKALEYIEKMNDICKSMTRKYDTGNFVADTLIGAKSAVAQEINTQIIFDGYIPSELENVDLVILLSNMLDNALEACKKIDGEKTISIESILQKRVWIIQVKNPTANRVKIQNNRIATTKSNKDIHGYGLQNMERVTQKYDGSLKLGCDDGTFTARAMLLLNKN